MRATQPDTNADRNQHAKPYKHANQHADVDAHRDPNADQDTHEHTDANGNPNLRGPWSVVYGPD